MEVRMNTDPDSLKAGDAEPASPEAVSELGCGLVAGANREPCGEFGINDGADLGGHTLLSRPAVPQGRRSLFRR